MKSKILNLFALLLLYPLSACLAQDDAPTATPTPLPAPLTLKSQVKLNDSDHRHFPRAPKTGPEGKVLRVDVDDHIARGLFVDNLTSPEAVSLIQGYNQGETKSDQYSWHTLNAKDYCHFHNGDSDWYGWRTGPDFHWVYSHSGLVWTHDHFADRWLYYDRGCWWWQGEDKAHPIQVYLEDGHYYACDATGVLGANLGTTGAEEVVTKPIVKETPSTPRDEDNPAAHAGMGGTGLGGGMKSY